MNKTILTFKEVCEKGITKVRLPDMPEGQYVKLSFMEGSIPYSRAKWFINNGEEYYLLPIMGIEANTAMLPLA